MASGLLLEACRQAGIQRFVYASSAWVYPRRLPGNQNPASTVFPQSPLSLYSASKLCGELLCAAYRDQFALQTTILRIDTPYGPYMRPSLVMRRFVESALEGRPLEVYGSGEQARGFLYADDLSRAFLLAATNENAAGKTLNISGPEHLTIAELAELVKRVLSSSSVIVGCPTRATDVDGQRLCGVETHAALGWTPPTRVAEGIVRLATWLSAAAHA